MFNDLWHDIMLIFGLTPKQPSLLAMSIHWTNNVKWVPRLVAYRQLDNWTSKKHNHEN